MRHVQELRVRARNAAGQLAHQHALELRQMAGNGRDIRSRVKRVCILSGVLIAAANQVFDAGSAIVQKDLDRNDPNFRFKANMLLYTVPVLTGLVIIYIALRECVNHVRGR